MTSIGELSVGLDLDTSALDQQIKNLGSRYQGVSLAAKLDGRGLNADWKQMRDRFNQQSLSLAVKLNAQGLEKEFRQYRERLSGYQVDVGVNLIVNFSQINAARTQLEKQLSVQTQVYPQNSAFFKEFEKGIAESITQGFKQAQSGNIFSGLGSLLSAPLQGAMQGLFMGFGLPLGKQIGEGLSKGLRTAVGESIGSFELLAERTVDKTVEGIGILRQQAAKLVQDNPVLSGVTAQFEQLNRILERYKINLKPQAIAAQFVQPQEASEISAARRFEKAEQRYKTRKKAAAALSEETLGIIQNSKIIEEIDKRIASRQKVIIAASKTIKRIEPLIAAQKATIEQQQNFNEATTLLSEVSDEITQLDQGRKEYINKLRSKIKQLSDLKIETELSSFIDSLFEASQSLTVQLQANRQAIESIALSQKNIKHKTPESIREQKEQRIRSNLKLAQSQFKEESLKADPDLSLLRKLRKQSESATKALGLFLVESASPKEFESKAAEAKSRLEKVDRDLKGAIEKLGHSLYKSVPDLTRKASTSATKIIQSGQAATHQSRLPTSRKISKKDDTTLFIRDIIEEIARLKNYTVPDHQETPTVQAAPKGMEASALYKPLNNTILLKKETIDRLLSGSSTSADIELITHELIHAFQFAFGKLSFEDILLSKKGGIPLTPLTPEQLQEYRVDRSKGTIAGSTENSVRLNAQLAKGRQSVEAYNLNRTIEGQAYYEGTKLTPQIEEFIKARKTLNEFLHEAGAGGFKFSETLLNEIKKARSAVATLLPEATSLGIPAPDTKTSTKSALAFYEKLKDLDLKTLNPEKIRSIKAIYESLLKQIYAPVDKLKAAVNQAQSNLKLPEAYQNIASIVGDFSGIAENISTPLIDVMEAAQGEETSPFAAYLSKLNKLSVSPKVLQELQRPEKLSYESVGLVSHELRHAAQFGFGKLDPTKGQLGVDLLTPTLDEFALMQDAIEQSVSAAKSQMPEVSEDLIRKLEQDAYTFELRYGKKIFESLSNVNKEIEDGLNNLQIPGISTEAAKAQQVLSQSVASVQQDLASQLADPGLIVKDLRKIAKLAGISGYSDKTRSNLEKLITESVAQGQTNPQLLNEILQGVSIERQKSRMYADTAIPKPTGETKAIAEELAQSSTQNIRQFAKETEVELTEAIERAKTIPNLSDRIQELDQLHASIIEAQSVALEAMTLHSDKAAQEHLEMLKVRLQASRKSVGMAATAAQSQATGALAAAAQAKTKQAPSSMEQAVRQKPGALYAMAAFGGNYYGIGIKSPSQAAERAADIEKEVEASAKRAAEIEGEITQAAQRGFIARIKRALGISPSLKPNEIAAKVEETVKQNINEIAQTAQEMELIQVATEGIRKRIKLAQPGEGLRKATQVIEQLNRQSEQELTNAVEQEANRSARQAQQNAEKINKLFLEVQQRTIQSQRKAAQDAADEQEHLHRQQANLLDRLGKRYNIYNFLKPELRQETPHDQPPTQSKFQQPKAPQLNLFNRLIAPTVKKQTSILALNAETLLADIQVQITEAKQAEKEVKLISKQIKNNETRIDKITSQILTEGQVRRLGQKALPDTELSDLNQKLQQLEQIVAEDKARLAAGEKPRQERKGLESIAQTTRSQLQEIGKLLDKDTLSDQDIKQLGKLRTGLTDVFNRMQQPLPGNNFLAQFGLSLPNITGNLAALLKGFLAFQALGFVQNLFQNIASGAFDAFIQLDNFRTSLNYAYDGAMQGASALKFVNKEVDRLRIPLNPAIEGFTQLSAATKGTAVEGETTRQLFSGIAEAATTLSLDAEKTSGVFLALSQTASKGKLQMEELLQIAERVPGSFKLVAQSMGVTEAELSKMLQRGEILAQDFLPRFGAQLKAQFGDAAETASNNAQSAVFAFQNSILSLQQKIGSGVAPTAIKGLNAMTGVLKFAANNGEALTKVLTATSAVLAVQLIPSVFHLVKALPFIQTGIAKVTGGLAGATAAAKTFALQFAVVLGAMELFNLSSRLIKGGELAKSFKDFENAAQNAAAGIKKLKTETDGLNQQEPPAANWSDSVLMFARNLPLLNKIPKDINIGGFNFSPFKTFAEHDRDKAIESIYNAGDAIRKATINVRKQVVKAQRGQGDMPLLKGIDDQLQQLSQRRTILQAEIERTYTKLGKTVPPEAKQQLVELNKEFQKLSEQRADVAKPYVDQLNRIKRAGEAAKSKLQSLNTPEGQIGFTGSNLEKYKSELEAQVKLAQEAESKLEKLLVVAKADPILTLSDAFRKLNVELAKNTEVSQHAAAARQEMIAKQELTSFGRDPFASQKAALQSARAERQTLLDEMATLQDAISERRAAVSTPSASPILQELGVSTKSSAAEIQTIIDRLPDGEKTKESILENLKQIQEDQLKMAQNRVHLAQQDLQVRQQIEAQITAVIEKEVADRTAIIQRGENEAIAQIRQRQLTHEITEKEASELIQKEQMKTLASQEDAARTQLDAYRKAYKAGQISAQQFVEKERDLVTQVSDFKKQKLEQELALRETINQRILENIEFANRKAEAAITESSSRRILELKKAAVAQENLTPEAQDALDKRIEQVQTDTLRQEIEETKRKLAQLDDLQKQGIKTDRDTTLEKIQLNEQLGQQQIQLVDQELAAIKRIQEEEEKRRDKQSKAIEAQIQAQEQLREKESKAIEAQIQAQEQLSEKAQAELQAQAKGLELQNKELDLLQKSDDLAKQLLNSRQNLAKALSNTAQGQAQVRLDRFSRGQELFGRILSDNNLTSSVSDRDVAYLKQVMASQLQQVGITVNFDQIGKLKEQAGQGSVEAQRRLNQMEVAVLEAKAKLEDEIAQKRLDALEMEQQYVQQSLEMDLRRNEIQAQSALFTAQQAEFETQQSELQLKNQLKIAELEEERAKLIEDQQERELAIAKARSQKELAELSLGQLPQQLEQASRLRELADDELNAQSELAQNARAAQEATQQNERSQFAAAEAARKQAEALQKAEIAAKGIAVAQNEAQNISGNGGNGDGNKQIRTFLAGSDQLAQYRQAQRLFSRALTAPGNQQTNILRLAMSGQNRSNPFIAQRLRSSGYREIQDLADSLQGGSQIRASRAIHQANLRGGDVVSELKKLNRKVEKLGRPNVSVSTATPLEDTLRVMSNMR